MSEKSNDSLLSSSLLFGLDCFFIEPSSSIFATYTIANILLLVPLCILILHRGLQRSASRAATTNHSDSFTYHLVIMEIINVFGSILCCCGTYWNNVLMIMMWYYLYCFIWYGKTFFHVLTCIEHFVAVVHPITYLSLRKQRGIRIRHITIGCVWLLCVGEMSLLTLENTSIILDICLLSFSVVIISFSSLFVLCVLIRPGPGKQGRDQLRVDRSKLRAFYTIMAILGVLLLRCAWNQLWLVQSVLKAHITECVWIIGEIWINIPSSLVLPLLFLHRAGTFTCFRNNIK